MLLSGQDIGNTNTINGKTLAAEQTVMWAA